MASIVRTLRSDSTLAPPTLGAGVLAYSSLSGKLFIGMGAETAGDAVNHFVIGGAYFTDMMDHVAGVLTADSVVIVDSNKKINEWNVDNLKLDGNTLSATDTNGDVVLAPDGTGTVNFSGKRGTNGADPISATDFGTKQYIDSVAVGVRDFKDSVRAVTTAAITLSGAQTIDGVSIIAGDRVLVKNQVTGSQNGIYVAAAGAWARSSDADSSAEVTSGLYLISEEGSTYAGSAFILATANPIVLNTTSLSFTLFQPAGTISGTTNRITVSSGVIDIDAAYIGQASITTLGTVATGVWQASTVATIYGGTGLTSYTTGDTVYASASNVLSKLAIGTTGQVYQVVAGVPAWGDIDGGTF